MAMMMPWDDYGLCRVRRAQRACCHRYPQATRHNPGLGIMAKRMQRDRLAQPRGFGGLLEQPAELTRGQRLMMTGTWKQPALFWREGGIIIRGRPYLPPLPQQLQDLCR